MAQRAPLAPGQPVGKAGTLAQHSTALRCCYLHHGARSKPDDDQVWTTDVDGNFIPSSRPCPVLPCLLSSILNSRPLLQWSPSPRYHPVNSVGREPPPCYANVHVHIRIRPSTYIHTSTSHVHIPRFSTPHAAPSTPPSPSTSTARAGCVS